MANIIRAELERDHINGIRRLGAAFAEFVESPTATRFLWLKDAMEIYQANVLTQQLVDQDAEIAKFQLHGDLPGKRSNPAAC